MATKKQEPPKDSTEDSASSDDTLDEGTFKSQWTEVYEYITSQKKAPEPETPVLDEDTDDSVPTEGKPTWWQKVKPYILS